MIFAQNGKITKFNLKKSQDFTNTLYKIKIFKKFLIYLKILKVLW